MAQANQHFKTSEEIALDTLFRAGFLGSEEYNCHIFSSGLPISFTVPVWPSPKFRIQMKLANFNIH
jgi:hypothetical protein